MSPYKVIPPNLQAVIFDLDGLILDSESVGFKVWSALAAEQGFTMTEALYRPGVGKGASKFVENLTREFGPGFDGARALRERPEKWTELLRSTRIEYRPGFLPLLEYLEKSNISRAIASSTERRLVTERLHSARLEVTRFQATVTGDEVERTKPAPDIYLKAAQLIGVPPENCLALEDTDVGASAAHAAGISVIIVPDLLVPSNDAREFAVSVENSLSDVLRLLQAC